jgi:hypothetical protein
MAGFACTTDVVTLQNVTFVYIRVKATEQCGLELKAAMDSEIC